MDLVKGFIEKIKGLFAVFQKKQATPIDRNTHFAYMLDPSQNCEVMLLLWQEKKSEDIAIKNPACATGRGKSYRIE